RGGLSQGEAVMCTVRTLPRTVVPPREGESLNRSSIPMIRSLGVLAFAAGAAWLLTRNASAQLNQQWVPFTNQPSKLARSPTAPSDNQTQVLFRTADLDKDGWDDVVAVRKQQASQIGKRTAFLLMNINGVLTNMTSQYASASDVPGDNGFLTPCNNREVAIG